MFNPFPASMEESRAVDLIQQYVQAGGDGSCVEGRWHQVPTGLYPSVIEKALQPFLTEGTPDIQIQDAMKLVPYYDVTGLAVPLQSYYESQKAKKKLSPEAASNILTALVQIAAGPQKSAVDREIQSRIAGDVLPDVGQKTVSSDWLALIWLADDLATMNTLEQNAKAYVKHNKAKELLQTDEGRDYRRFQDWTNSTLRNARESLEKKAGVLSKSAPAQIEALVSLYLDSRSDPTQLTSRWAAGRLRAIAVKDPAMLPVLIGTFRKSLPAFRDDRAAQARIFDAMRYFGGALSIPEQKTETAVLKKIDYQLFFDLSMRSYYRSARH